MLKMQVFLTVVSSILAVVLCYYTADIWGPRGGMAILESGEAGTESASVQVVVLCFLFGCYCQHCPGGQGFSKVSVE